MIMIVKTGESISDQFFIWSPKTFIYRTEYLMLKGFQFEDNIVYLN